MEKITKEQLIVFLYEQKKQIEADGLIATIDELIERLEEGSEE